MKIKLTLPAIVLGLMLLLTGSTVKAQDNSVSLQQFYDELSPYGTWIQDPQYGYVWRPDVDQSDFRPYYTNGRWVMTEYGNTWVSNYEWGWAPFHYGRWIADSYNRWVWIPDTTWGPAWVDWRSGGGYYGWAPMGPLFSININIGRRYVRPDYSWNFIPMRNIYINSFPRYRSYNNVTIINRTKIINNTYVRNNNTYYTGPRPEEIRRATNQNVQIYQVARNNRAGAPVIDRNTVNIYTPRPSRGGENANPAPRNIASNANANRPERSGVTPRDNSISPRTERSNSISSPKQVEGIRNDRSSGTTRTEQASPARQQASPVRQQARPDRTEAQRAATAPKSQERQMQAPTAQRSQPQPQQQRPARQEQVQQQRQQPQVQQSRPARTEQSRGSNNNSSSGQSNGGGRPARGGGE